MLYDIDELLKDDNDVYDLTQITFNYDPEVAKSLGTYIVQRGEEMRIDLVCESIYGKTDFIDILCNINGIDNPLNIIVGEKIVYPQESDIIRLRYREEVIKEDRIINNSPSKSNKKDSNRKDYVENNRTLPPTQMTKRINPINSDSPKLIIGDGLFNR